LGVAGIVVLLENDYHGINPKTGPETVIIEVEFAILN